MTDSSTSATLLVHTLPKEILSFLRFSKAHLSCTMTVRRESTSTPLPLSPAPALAIAPPSVEEHALQTAH